MLLRTALPLDRTGRKLYPIAGFIQIPAERQVRGKV